MFICLPVCKCMKELCITFIKIKNIQSTKQQTKKYLSLLCGKQIYLFSFSHFFSI